MACTESRRIRLKSSLFQVLNVLFLSSHLRTRLILSYYIVILLFYCLSLVISSCMFLSLSFNYSFSDSSQLLHYIFIYLVLPPVIRNSLIPWNLGSLSPAPFHHTVHTSSRVLSGERLMDAGLWFLLLSNRPPCSFFIGTVLGQREELPRLYHERPLSSTL